MSAAGRLRSASRQQQVIGGALHTRMDQLRAAMPLPDWPSRNLRAKGAELKSVTFNNKLWSIFNAKWRLPVVRGSYGPTRL